MSTIFSPEIILLNITQKCRLKLFDDILNDSDILYAALYSNENSEIYHVYQERYDLFWLKSHWDLLSEYIKAHKLTATQKGQLLSQFARWYCGFIEKSSLDVIGFGESTQLMQEIIELKIRTLENIIEYDKRCNDNMQKIETSFMKSFKIMNDRVKKMKTERKNYYGSN